MAGSITVICIACGRMRHARRTQTGLDAPQCPSCAYVGWIPSDALPPAWGPQQALVETGPGSRGRQPEGPPDGEGERLSPPAGVKARGDAKRSDRLR